MKYEGIVPTLPVKNIQETHAFYKEKLGFTIHWTWEENFSSVFAQDAFEVFLSKSDSSISPITCYIRVDDADSFYSKFKESGVKIIEEIGSRPWGTREFVIEELNGHRFRFGHGEKGVREIETFKLDPGLK